MGVDPWEQSGGGLEADGGAESIEIIGDPLVEAIELVPSGVLETGHPREVRVSAAPGAISA